MERRDPRRIGGRSRHRGSLVRGRRLHPRARHLDTHAEPASHGANILQRVRPIECACLGEHTGALRIPGQNPADVPRLSGNSRLKRGKNLIRGTLVGSGQLGGHRSLRLGDLRHLEDGHVRVRASDVTARDVQQRIEHRGA